MKLNFAGKNEVEKKVKLTFEVFPVTSRENSVRMSKKVEKSQRLSFHLEMKFQETNFLIFIVT